MNLLTSLLERLRSNLVSMEKHRVHANLEALERSDLKQTALGHAVEQFEGVFKTLVDGFHAGLF